MRRRPVHRGPLCHSVRPLRLLLRLLAGDGVPPRGPALRRCLPDEQWRGLHMGVPSGRQGRTHPSLASDVGRAFEAMVHAASPELFARIMSSATRRSARPRGMSDCRTTSASRSARAGHWSATPATTATRSPATASATRSATPSCWPARSTGAARRGRRERRARRLPRTSATWPLREIFDITCELVHLPRRARFVELQKQLSRGHRDARRPTLAARPARTGLPPR